MSNRIFFKLLLAFLLVLATAMAAGSFFVGRAWETSLRQEIERNLRQKTLLFAHRVNSDRQHALPEIAAQAGRAAGSRATLIAVRGHVLADS